VIVDVGSTLESLNCVNVGSVANISEVSVDFIFRVKVIIRLILELYVLRYFLHQKKILQVVVAAFTKKIITFTNEIVDNVIQNKVWDFQGTQVDGRWDLFTGLFYIMLCKASSVFSLFHLLCSLLADDSLP
jgi:hypothetical protein